MCRAYDAARYWHRSKPKYLTAFVVSANTSFYAARDQPAMWLPDKLTTALMFSGKRFAHPKARRFAIVRRRMPPHQIKPQALRGKIVVRSSVKAKAMPLWFALLLTAQHCSNFCRIARRISARIMRYSAPSKIQRTPRLYLKIFRLMEIIPQLSGGNGQDRLRVGLAALYHRCPPAGEGEGTKSTPPRAAQATVEHDRPAIVIQRMIASALSGGTTLPGNHLVGLPRQQRRY